MADNTKNALTSEEVNFLVYRYLLESGFVHSAFTFAHESFVTKSRIESSKVPPGALITFIQKGLQYVEIEAHINEDGTETVCDESFSVLAPHKCSVKSKRRIFNPHEPVDADYGALDIQEEAVKTLKGHTDMVTVCAFNPANGLLASGSCDGATRLWDTNAKESKGKGKTSEAKEGKSEVKSGELASSFTLTNPDDEDEDSPKKKKNKKTAKKTGKSDEKGSSNSRTIGTLDWSPKGTYLATGACTGRIAVWTSSGQLHKALAIEGLASNSGDSSMDTGSGLAHLGPVSCLRWNRKGDCLLSAGTDGRAVVWDPSSGKPRQQYSLHKGTICDVDWRTDTSFVTCATDKLIHLCNVSSPASARQYVGHEGDVNCVRWSPDGKFLASASADKTVKLWTADSDKCTQDMQEHGGEVSILRWSNTGPGTEHPNQMLLLASASRDAVKIWDIEDGTASVTLSKHSHPITTMSFSPNGEYLACGSHDRLLVWATKDWKLVRSYRSPGGISDLSWNTAGTQIAAGFSDNSLFVVDVRR